MLKPPYKNYNLLHIYNVDKKEININDPDLIGIWEEENTLLLFFHKNKDFLIKELNLKLHFYTILPYVDWESGKFIKSFKVGDFFIVPVWEKDNFKNKNQILIDPSVVFGSGFHPTTRMILESFNNLFNNLKVNSCIDLGCGSGILSIFAGILGVKEIVAIDNNNLSFEVAKKNFSLNKINAKLFYGDIFSFLNQKYDVVFANLYYHLLFDLFKNKSFWKSKYYFLSGFVEKMEQSIILKLPDNVKILEKKKQENWIMLLIENLI